MVDYSFNSSFMGVNALYMAVTLFDYVEGNGDAQKRVFVQGISHLNCESGKIVSTSNALTGRIHDGIDFQARVTSTPEVNHTPIEEEFIIPYKQVPCP